MYDDYISLGLNCEAAFQFRRLRGRDIAHYFNWMVTPFESLIRIIESDFEGLFAREAIEPASSFRMVKDTKFNVMFHSPFHKELGERFSGPAFDALYTAHLGKLEYLKARWFSVTASDRKVLYVVKTNDDGAREKARVLRDLMLRKYSSHDFDLLILQPAAKGGESWTESRLFNRYLRRFAPIDDAPDGHLESWNKIFAEFPLARKSDVTGQTAAA